MNGLSALIVVAALLGAVWLGAGVAGQETLFGVVIPYAAIAVFLLGLVYRVLSWARAPVPFKITSSSGQQTSLPWIKAEKLESPPDARYWCDHARRTVRFSASLALVMTPSRKKSIQGKRSPVRRVWLSSS